MRPVNLLPERLRPRRPTGQLQGSAYVLIGVLGALVLAVLLYVVTLNQIHSRTTDAARAESEAQQADARAATLGPFGQFAQVKATREASVKTLAEGRIDWERAVRELALVLPPDTWITEVDGSTGAQSADSARSSTPTPTPSTANASASAGKPNLKLVGCAIAQPDVAVLLVRLRRLHDVEDVQLAESAREETDANSSGTGGSSGGGSESSGGADNGCGHDFKFDLTVTFKANDADAAPAPKHAKKVPAVLGGGS
jgi:type II secretory pathway pseudopilin PulG